MDTEANRAYDGFLESKWQHSSRSWNVETRCLQFCRLLMYIIIFAIVLLGGVLNKLDLLQLISEFSQSAGQERTTHAVQLLAVVCIYPCFTVLCSLIKLMSGKDGTSVTTPRVILAAVMDIFHMCGVLMLIYKVLPFLSGFAALFLMMCSPLGPAFCLLVSKVLSPKGVGKNKLLRLGVYLTSALLLLGGYLAMFWNGVLETRDKTDKNIMWIAPLSVLLISCTWWENFLNLTVPRCWGGKVKINESKRSHRTNRNKLKFLSALGKLCVVSIAVALSVWTSYSFFSVENMLQHTDFNTTENNVNDLDLTSKSKLQMATDEADDGSFSEPVDNFAQSEPLVHRIWEFLKDFLAQNILPIKIILQTLIISYSALLACKLLMQRSAFALASVLICPLTILYVALRCAHPDMFNIVFINFDDDYMCPASDGSWAGYLASACMLWIGLLIVTSHVWMPENRRMEPDDRLFILPVKDCILTDINLLMRRTRETNTDIIGTETDGDRVPKVYICATMWHENRTEMTQLIKSLLRLDQHCTQMTTDETMCMKGEDPEKFESEVHIIFDDAFCVDHPSQTRTINNYVHQFLECLEAAALGFVGPEEMATLKAPLKAALPYGGRLTWIMPYGTKMTIHLKDSSKIRRGKRWSQIAYMYYLLGYKMFGYKSVNEVAKKNMSPNIAGTSYSAALQDLYKNSLHNTYILTLDGDVDFEPRSVLMLIDRLKRNPNVGAVCGRVHPIGSGPVVWYQKFEYALGHWLSKTSEHVLGCILCCPGCFALFRGSALADDNVMKTYTRKPEKPIHYIMREQGEDRYLCNLLIKQGYKIEYCSGADARTFSPDTFDGFFIQRRRWNTSSYALNFHFLMSWRQIVHKNASINRFFILFQFILVCINLLAPVTIIELICGLTSAILGFSIITSYLLSVTPVVFYIIVCMLCKQKIQLIFGFVLSSLYCIMMISLTFGVILQTVISGDVLSVEILFLLVMIALFLGAALFHPKEFGNVCYMWLYYICVPAVFIVLTVYYLCNINTVKWGTREGASAQSGHKHPAKPNNSKLIPTIISFLSESILKEKIASNGHVKTSGDEEHFKESDKIDSVGKHSWMTAGSLGNFQEDVEVEQETKFWDSVLEKYLQPPTHDINFEKSIRSELVSLRNKAAFTVFMANFIISLCLLQLSLRYDELRDYFLFNRFEPAVVLYAAVFAIIFIVSFAAMVVHRWGTFQHLVSISSLCCKTTVNCKVQVPVDRTVTRF